MVSFIVGMVRFTSSAKALAHACSAVSGCCESAGWCSTPTEQALLELVDAGLQGHAEVGQARCSVSSCALAAFGSTTMPSAFIWACSRIAFHHRDHADELADRCLVGLVQLAAQDDIALQLVLLAES